MTDWQFGDVLRLAETKGHDTIVMFLARQYPARWTGTKLEFWGFTGLYLPPPCPTTGYPACPYGHFDWTLGAFGGHPEAPHNSWVLE